MIKLIASDLDGTLLDEEKRLPQETFALIEELYARGVLFAPASGRQYENLRHLFAPVADKVLFICENGALVKYRGETLHLNPIRKERIPFALATVRSIPHVYPMLCGAKCAYLENDVLPFSRLAKRAYTNCKVVSSLNDVIDEDDFCKIAIYDELGSANNVYLHLPQRLPDLRCILSGAEWCDVSMPTANKGEAIKTIMRSFGFTRENCVAFGDHMNDYEMLLACGTAYVPENAYPPLKDEIKNVVPANTQGGVLQKIKEIIKIIDGEKR